MCLLVCCHAKNASRQPARLSSRTSALAPGCIVHPPPPLLGEAVGEAVETGGGGASVKVAVHVRLVSRVTVPPGQVALQPAKIAVAPGVAVSTTVVPRA